MMVVDPIDQRQHHFPQGWSLLQEEPLCMTADDGACMEVWLLAPPRRVT